MNNIIRKYEILTEDIYNFDETDFQMRVISTVKMMTESKKAEKSSLTQSEN
jgi:hypothetical protein